MPSILDLLSGTRHVMYEREDPTRRLRERCIVQQQDRCRAALRPGMRKRKPGLHASRPTAHICLSLPLPSVFKKGGEE